MKTTPYRKTLPLLSGGLLFFAGWLLGNENPMTQKTVIHAAAWTALGGVTQQDLDRALEGKPAGKN